MRDGRDTLFWVFCLVAFKGALWLDMRAGNVVVFEQLALWGGFYFFVRERLAVFCLLTLVAASFKLVPVVFLSLLLLVKHPRRYRYLAISSAGFVAFLLVQAVTASEEMHSFLRNSLNINERGFGYNPSLLALVQDGTAAVSRRILFAEATPVELTAGLSLSQSSLSWLLYAILATTVVTTSAWFWRRAGLTGEWGRLVLVSVACLVFALTLPRFKSYSFVQVLLPTYLLLAHIRRTRAVLFGLLFVLAVLSNVSPLASARWPGGITGSAIAYAWAYYALFLSAGAWGLLLHLFLTESSEPLQETTAARIGTQLTSAG